MKRTLLTLALIFSVLTAMADDKAKYREFADTIRKQVYSLDLPAFKNATLPDKYKDKSVVYKAIYEEYNAKKKTGVGFNPGQLNFLSQRAQVHTWRLTRMLIHLNDQAAIDRYSEFDFGTFDKRKPYYKAYENTRRALGVRVIKPDGRTIDIDTSDFVEVQEGADGKKKSRKLAVPGLEPGDDIDVFMYTETKLQNIHPDPETVMMKSDAPIVNYALHCVMDDDLSVFYQTLNGALDFTVTRDNNKNYVLDLSMADISAAPRRMYDADFQSPQVRFSIFNRRSDQYTPESARKDGLRCNADGSVMLADLWGTIDYSVNKYTALAKQILSEFIADGDKIWKTLNNRVKKGEMTPTAGLDYLSNLLIYGAWATQKGINPWSHVLSLQDAMVSWKKPYVLGSTTFDDTEPLDRLNSMNNAIYWLRLDGDTVRYYTPPRGFYAPGELPGWFQGQKAALYTKAKEVRKKGAVEYFNLPYGTPESNRNLSDLKVTVNGTELNVDRTESYIGSTKIYAFPLLADKNIDRDFNKYFEEAGIPVLIEESKKKRADRMARYDEELRTMRDKFKDEITDNHGVAPTEMKECGVTDSGIDPRHPALTYSSSYTLPDMTRKAGKNLVVSVGRLMSEQSKLLPSERTRDVDAWVGAPRRFETHITLALPEGFTVSDKALKDLERNVVTRCGSFTAQASQQGNEVLITTVKEYTAPRVSAEEWPEMLRILDAAAQWNAETLLLTKK